MLTGYNWNQEKLFFFDEGKKKRWEKRKKRALDSLPITLLRDVRPSVALQVGNRTKRELMLANEGNEETNENASNLNEEVRKTKKKTQADLKLLDLADEDDDEDTQKFLYEEAKFAAINLLSQIEKFLIVLRKFRHDQKTEIQQLNAEILAVYGEHWTKNSLEDRVAMFDIPDDLYHQLCFDFEHLAAGTIYVKREWQTSVYRDLSALNDIKGGDAVSFLLSPDPMKIFNERSIKVPLVERGNDRKSDKQKMLGTQTKSALAGEASPALNIKHESKASIPASIAVSKPRLRAEKSNNFQDKGRWYFF